MSIAIYGVSKILAPLYGFWRKAAPKNTVPQNHTTPALTNIDRLAVFSVSSSTQKQDIPFTKNNQAHCKRPLRVVRILEADHIPANVGRMMISGRMADVCAELDRLAARETPIH